MAPRGQVQYNRDVIRRNVRILCDDIAKKGRNSRQSMWDTVQRARAAHRAANPGGVIEPLRWPLPDVQQLGQSTTGPPYMPQNPRGRAGATLLNATQESNTERARIAAHGAQGPGPAAPAAVPAAQGPAPAPAPALAVAAPAPAVPIPPEMQQVAIVVPPPSLLAGGGGVAGGLLAGHSCRRAVPHGWPTSTGGPPTSVRIHVITPENHTRDVACGGWLFTAITVSGTLRILAHTMAELVLRSQPFLPWELGASRQISRFYVLDRPDRWRVLPLGVANDLELARHITVDYFGGNMLDLQVELQEQSLGGEELYADGEELYADREELYADREEL
ncbi:hypothetical protein L211DRAFT_854414 [Terfezia boudieri ATCC MYA-4762]|uniref:Uncharacterized protein n=1 Tax=Terfezia boudieri ATCC MYA-4762 TaxID=1051890 RepID=A0A3N4L8Q3_9PEZI|nr:hypothetical protein L211DRAFT_854414 [Terfezia boudieri ATCC MYA-4762]